MSERIYVADKATLDKVYENTQKLLNNLVPLDSPVYGMIIMKQIWIRPRGLSILVPTRTLLL